MIAIKATENKLLQRNYSENTRKIYLYFLRDFDAFCSQNNLNPQVDVQPYILHLIHNGYSVSTQNQAINAIKFYWENMLGMPRQVISIDRPMKPRSIPIVMSANEVSDLLKSVRNLKHRMILTTIYALGLRISELCNLRIENIDGKRHVIQLQNAKGSKDRMVPIPEILLEDLRVYYRAYKPYHYLFEGEGSSPDMPKRYSETSIRTILKRAAKQVGITKKVSPHTLRHSYATHLVDQGINLRSIQVLMGHNSSKTTEIYTHISNYHLENTPSPLEFLP